MTQQHLTHRTTLTSIIIATLMLIALPAQAASYRLLTSYTEVDGTAALESGDIDTAITAFETALEYPQVKDRGAILNNLCVAFASRHDYDNALRVCEEAVAANCGKASDHFNNRDFEDAIAHNNRGVLRARQGDFDAALDDFDMASRPIIAPNDVRRSMKPYGHEIRYNARLAIRDRLEWVESEEGRLADIQ